LFKLSTMCVSAQSGSHHSLDVQEGELLPVLLLLAHADEARDVEALGKQLQVLHQLLRPAGWGEGGETKLVKGLQV